LSSLLTNTSSRNGGAPCTSVPPIQEYLPWAYDSSRGVRGSSPLLRRASLLGVPGCGLMRQTRW